MFGTRFARVGASVGVLGVIGALVAAAGSAGAASPAAASGNGGVQTQVFKTVNQMAAPSGSVTANTMTTQVSAAGNGTLNVQVPVGTSSLRNLNGFASAPTQGNNLVLNQQVSGSLEQRYMSPTDLQPIKVNVETTLDGKPINPADVVGKTGVLDVKYHITNTTAAKTQVTYKDGSGNDVTQEMDTAVPFTGSLTTTLPAGFNEVNAPGANAAVGDGHNGTEVNYSMVLFPPLGGSKFPAVGASKVTLGYQSRISNGTLPSAMFNFTPIVPYSDSTISQTKDALGTEAADGAKLVSGGDEMAQSLAKLTGPQGVPYLISQMQSGAVKARSSLNTLLGSDPNNDAMGGAKNIRDSIQTKVLGALTKKSNQDAIDQLAGIEPLLKGLVGLLLASLPMEIAKIGNACFPGSTPPCSQAAGNTVAAKVTTMGTLLLPVLYIGGLQNASTGMGGNLTTIKNTCPSCEGLAAYSTLNSGISTIGGSAVTPWQTLEDLPGSGGWTWNADGEGTVPAFIEDLASKTAYQLLEIPQLQNLFRDGPALKTAIGEFVDAVQPMLEQAQATLDAVAPTAEPLEGLLGDLEGAVPISQQIGDDANAIVAAGPDQLTALGQQLINENAPQVAQLDTMQAEAQTGVGHPYGQAVGTNVSTNSIYNLNVAGAGEQGKDNAINWVIGVILLIVGGGVGTSLWVNRRKASA